MSGDLPPPHVLAALGTVLCLYPSQARHELAGWTRAVRAACDSRLDSDGLCESVQFATASAAGASIFCRTPTS